MNFSAISKAIPPPSPPVKQCKTVSRRTRVLYIMDSIWNIGGAESCLLRMTKHLPKDEFECQVLTFHTSPEARWFLDKFDCPVHHWQLKNLYSRNAFQVGRKLWQFVRDQEIDIVHSFFQTSDLCASPIAKLAGARALVSSRRDMGFLRKGIHNLGYRLMRGMFDQVHAVSEGVRGYTLKQDGVDPSRIITVYNGIETSADVSAEAVRGARRTLGLGTHVPVVITVANSRYVKGIDVLVRASALAIREFPDTQFLVVGGLGGDERDRIFTREVMDLSESLGTVRNVRFLGKSRDVAVLLSASTVFALPSRTEGHSNALLEAMRAGLPCVATAVGGNSEVVGDGRTGFLVPPDDAPALADRICRLLGNARLRDDMGAAGQTRFMEQFTVDSMVSCLVEAYRTILVSKEPWSKVLAIPSLVSSLTGTVLLFS